MFSAAVLCAIRATGIVSVGWRGSITGGTMPPASSVRCGLTRLSCSGPWLKWSLCQKRRFPPHGFSGLQRPILRISTSATGCQALWSLGAPEHVGAGVPGFGFCWHCCLSGAVPEVSQNYFSKNRVENFLLSAHLPTRSGSSGHSDGLAGCCIFRAVRAGCTDALR